MTRSPNAPGSVRHSVALLGALAVAGVVVIGLADGLAAAAVGLALFTVAGLAVARYAAGAGSQDSGHRRQVRLLATREPALGSWESIVRHALGADGGFHFGRTLRPQLQRLFAARLAERHGVSLHHSPERARDLVGPELWPWIDPADRPPQSAMTEDALRALLDRLEAL